MAGDAISASDYELVVNALVQVSRLNLARTLPEVMETLSELLRHLIGADAYVIAVRNPSLDALEATLVVGDSPGAEHLSRFVTLQQNYYGNPLAAVPLQGRDNRLVGLIIITQLVVHKAGLDVRDYNLLDVLREHGGASLDAALTLATLQRQGRPVSRVGALLGPEPLQETWTPSGSLVIRVGHDDFALALECVREVFQMVAVRSRPLNMAPSCVGIIDHRGMLIPLFDLMASMTRTPARQEDALVDAFVIVLDDGNERFGCVVDDITGLYDADEQQVVPLPEQTGGHGTQSAIVLAHTGRVVPLFRHGRALLNDAVSTRLPLGGAP